MTSAEKQKIADFLDITRDFLLSGYRSEASYMEYQADEPISNPETQKTGAGIKKNSFPDAVKESIIEKPQINNINPEKPDFPADDTLEKIAQEIMICKNCALCGKRTNTVPGEGVSQPLVMVIGEGPGEDEDKQGRPFVGKAGQLLDKMLLAIGLSRTENAYIANTVKCRPPNNRNPYPEETAACAHFLERQISVLKPKFILAAGKVSANALLKTNETMANMRGKCAEITVAQKVYPVFVTYHPAALLRSESLKRPAWEDLKLLRSKLELPAEHPEN